VDSALRTVLQRSLGSNCIGTRLLMPGPERYRAAGPLMLNRQYGTAMRGGPEAALLGFLPDPSSFGGAVAVGVVAGVALAALLALAEWFWQRRQGLTAESILFARFGFGPLPETVVLRHVLGAADLMALVSNSLVFLFRHDEVEGEDADLVGTFLSDLSHLRDIPGDIGPGGSVEAAASLSARLRELEAAGFRVFAGRVRELRSSEHGATPWPVVVVHVRRAEMVADTEVIEAAVG